MNSRTEKAPACTVKGADKLPKELGGADALCQAIAAAFAESNVTGPVAVEVTVRSPHGLAAKIERAGTSLSELSFDASDSVLTKGAIGRFAQSIAQHAKGNS